MNQILINAHDLCFAFQLDDDATAWFDLDGQISVTNGATLRINADREVYARLSTADNQVFYGTIGDENDEVLADDFAVNSGETYIFYDHPETENSYI